VDKYFEYSFYALAADRQEYCLQKIIFIIIFVLRTGDGPPKVQFYKKIKFIFEPQQHVYQIRVKNSWG